MEIDLKAVLREESKDILQRRCQVGLHYASDEQLRQKLSRPLESQPQPSGRRSEGSGNAENAGPEVPENLTGLALSGGGIRSACISLGLVQAFHKQGVMRVLDYLSTVSGGGYIGSYLSSSVVRQQQQIDRFNFNLAPLSGNRQPPRVLRFIYGGPYLLRPWLFANKYLVGLVFNNIAFVSGLIAACALFAFLWRSLDYRAARDLAGLLEWNFDAYTPFFPFVFFLICWIVAWSTSYWRHGAEAPGRFAQYFLYLWVASLFIGVVVLLSNGDTTLGFLETLTGYGTLESSYPLGKTLLLLVLPALLPFLRPTELLRSGMAPRRWWEQWIFRIATTALLIGIPLLVIDALARENISGYATNRDGELCSEDVRNWQAFLALVPAIDEPPASRSLSDSAQTLLVELDNLEQAETEFKGTEPGWDRWNNPNRLSRAMEIPGWLFGRNNDLARFWQQRAKVRELQMSLIHRVNEELLSSHELPDRILAGEPQPLVLASEQDHAPESIEAASLPAADENSSDRILAGEPQSPVLASGQDHAPEGIEAASLPAADESSSDREVSFAGYFDGVGALDETKAYRRKLKEFDRRLGQIIMLADESGPRKLADRDLIRLNRRLLEAQYPRMFYDPTVVQRRIVIYEDQRERLRWLMWSALIFVAIGLWVDVNSTSLHRYYRNSVAQAFIEPQAGARADVNLSELKTTDYGAPYHLINASVSLVRAAPSRQDSGQTDAPATASRWLDTFLFSRRFCGSQITGYAKTEHYERFLKDNVSLADATALSGSAVNPGAIDNWLLALLMLICNFRLGQWLPNPRAGKPLFRARVASLLVSFFRHPTRRPYCFISDGGFSENLGLTALLKRRCRLIVVLDATHDPDHDFRDLTRALRVARVHGGIEVSEFQSCGGDAGENVQAREYEELKMKHLEISSPARYTQAHFTVARIHYPERVVTANGDSTASKGVLIYIKPSLTGDEGLELQRYQKITGAFPHDATTDLMYDEAQVEAYRRLGYHLGDEVCRALREALPPEQDDFWTTERLDMPRFERSLRSKLDEEARRSKHVTMIRRAYHKKRNRAIDAVCSLAEHLKNTSGQNEASDQNDHNGARGRPRKGK